MVGYEIIYGKKTYDCWGATDFDWFGRYNMTIYTSKEKALNKIKEFEKEEASSKDTWSFDIRTVNIDFDDTKQEAF